MLEKLKDIERGPIVLADLLITDFDVGRLPRTPAANMYYYWWGSDR